MDVKIAYLNVHFKEEVYMVIPQDVLPSSPLPSRLVSRLLRTVYGLKKSANKWFLVIDNYVIFLHLVKCLANDNIYVRCTQAGVIFLAIYIDDLLLSSNSLTLI